MFVQRINYIAVFTCVVVQFVLGLIWYSPWVFSDLWFSLAKTNIESFDAMGIRPYIFSIVALFISTYALAWVMIKADARGVLSGAKIGFLMWLGFLAPLEFASNEFKGFALELSLIESCIDALNFTIAGAVLASWKQHRYQDSHF